MDSYQKGETFEKYVEQYLFPAYQYTLIEKTHSKQTNNKRFIESTQNPDFKFRNKYTGQEFYVDAKYRSGFDNSDKMTLCSQDQFNRFSEIDRTTCPVYFIVGYGGPPSNPEFISLIPIREMKFLDLYASVITRYSIGKEKPVNPNRIAKNYGHNATTENQAGRSQVEFKNESIRSGKVKTKWIPYTVIIVAIVMIASFLYFRPADNTQEPDMKILKGQIENYYKAVQTNNVEALDYYLTPVLDRWFAREHLTIDEVKKDALRYYRKYPHQIYEINWNTFQYARMGNGDYTVSYEMNYSINPQSKGANKKFHLKIYAILNTSLKIKSLYEVKL